MYHHLNTLTIFPERLAHNLEILSRLHPDVQAVPVVKSNAYGHGIKLLAPILDDYEVPFICVDSLYEAFELEKNGYFGDVLIMGYVDPRDIPRRTTFIYAVSDLDYGLALKKNYSKVRMHLFLDTGMNREGLALNNKEEIINNKGGLLNNIPSDKGRSDKFTPIIPHIEGITSHLSTPDNREVTEAQIISFQESVEILEEIGISPKYVHIFASGGLIHADKNFSAIGNLARTGLAFYGYGHPDLLPALRVTTRLIQIKEIGAGECVGYDRTFVADKTMKIGLLPIGYHDGMDRRLSNVGLVMIRNQFCPIVGRVSMNLTTIDISDIPNASIGDEVVFIDEDPTSEISLERQAAHANMIPYDMLVHLSKEMFRQIC